MKRKRETNLKITKELEEFINNLQVWADNWIDEVNNVILDHIEELYSEDCVHYILNIYVHKKEILDSFNKNYLLRAYEDGTDVDKHEFYAKEVSELSETLYKLCYKRFKDREEMKKND